MYLTHDTVITTESQEEFLPTFLYIKQHAVTGKLYFGKTCKSHDEMLAYLGSGLHWNRHLAKHGAEHVTTPWYCLFTDKDDCVSFATGFSIQENIVESKDWANLMIENGLDGSPKGRKSSDETRKKLSSRGAPAKLASTGIKIGKVPTDDPRWATGEIVHTTTGTVMSESEKVKRQQHVDSTETRLQKSKSASGTGNSQFGTTFMVNHETKEKTRVHKSRVNELQEKGWVCGNKHSYTYIKLGVLLTHSS